MSDSAESDRVKKERLRATQQRRESLVTHPRLMQHMFVVQPAMRQAALGLLPFVSIRSTALVFLLSKQKHGKAGTRSFGAVEVVKISSRPTYTIYIYILYLYAYSYI